MAKINGQRVDILNGSFMNCSSLSNLFIQNVNYLSLGKNAFVNCKKLENVDFWKIKTIQIGEECFNGSNIKI